ncbi:LysR family transcriptional regulator [Clostridium folliculivorans]|uniref:LysR family transcriptional regulator n=1 Tax=Clostridium folliculivorans TaxID=2886038 RepID=A0A9W5Y2U7_9CLOT|nr:LysR family transcriptional regulator [Clostridium folliculivorans]GKU25537.1 LysR family transcriptional regulator [Clostridium folliculivorans]GKU28560.1 LysR family transcriptional regulator [Clostridium folliculivorans]
MIDIRLKTFMTVAELKNFTRASEKLNITQPAVSQHIRFLEEEYDVKLFTRQGKEAKLTGEGEILYRHSKEIHLHYKALEVELKNKNAINKTYKIGASMTIGGYILPAILGKYKRVHKNTKLFLQVSNTKNIIEKLSNGDIDLAIVEGDFDRNKFIHKKLKDDELVLAVSKEHQFAKRAEVDLKEVLKGELILREKGSGTRNIFEKRLIELKIINSELSGYMEIGSISAIKSLINANLGYSIISKETILNEIKSGDIKVVPIKGFKIYREFNFVYIKDHLQDFFEEFFGFYKSVK